MVVTKEKKTDRIAKLAKELNFAVKTINGCRYFGPTIDDKPAFPPKGTEIFVGRLPSDAYEDEIYKHFITFGNIYRLKMSLNLDCTTKGYCFVMYKTIDDAQQAVQRGGRRAFRRNGNIFLHVAFSTNTSILEITDYDTLTTLSKVKKDITEHCDIIAPFNITELQSKFVVDFIENQDANVVLKKLTPLAQDLWGDCASIHWQYNRKVCLREINKIFWEQEKIRKIGIISSFIECDRLHVVVPDNLVQQSSAKSQDSGVNSPESSPEVNVVRNRATNIVLPKGAELAIIPNGFDRYSCYCSDSISESEYAAGTALPFQVQPLKNNRRVANSSGQLGMPSLSASDTEGTYAVHPYLAQPLLYNAQSANRGAQVTKTASSQLFTSDCKAACAADPYIAQPLAFNERAAYHGAQTNIDALPRRPAYDSKAACTADPYIAQPLAFNERAAYHGAQTNIDALPRRSAYVDRFFTQPLAFNEQAANKDGRIASTASSQLIATGKQFISPRFQNHEVDKIWHCGASNEMTHTTTNNVINQGAAHSLESYKDKLEINEQTDAANKNVVEDPKSLNPSSQANDVLHKLNDEFAKMLHSRDPGTIRDAGLIKRFFLSALKNKESTVGDVPIPK